MSTTLSPLSQHFLTADSGATANARARAHAYDAITTQIPVVARVNYQSDGYVLIIGTAAAADAAAQVLTACPDLHICALITDSTQPAGTVEAGGPVRRVHGCADGLTGYLGQFEIQTGNPLLATALQLSLPADKPVFDLSVSKDRQHRCHLHSDMASRPGTWFLCGWSVYAQTQAATMVLHIP